MNIVKRVEVLESMPVHNEQTLSDLKSRIYVLEEIIENKLGFYIPKRS